MTTRPITIENGRVTIRPNATDIWLTQSQIADLFGVFTSAVHANIRSILKSGVLDEDRVFAAHAVETETLSSATTSK